MTYLGCNNRYRDDDVDKGNVALDLFDAGRRVHTEIFPSISAAKKRQEVILAAIAKRQRQGYDHAMIPVDQNRRVLQVTTAHQRFTLTEEETAA